MKFNAHLFFGISILLLMGAIAYFYAFPKDPKIKMVCEVESLEQFADSIEVITPNLNSYKSKPTAVTSISPVQKSVEPPAAVPLAHKSLAELFADSTRLDSAQFIVSETAYYIETPLKDPYRGRQLVESVFYEQDANGEFVPGRARFYVLDEIMLIKPKALPYDEFESKVLQYNAKVKDKMFDGRIVSVKLPKANATAVREAIAHFNEQSLKADPIGFKSYFEEVNPNDRHFAQYQWNLKSGGINAQKAWTIDTAIADDVVIAVLDCGIHTTHEDLKDNLWKNSGEIEDDGIDNDNNGFIDDVHGVSFVDADKKLRDGKGHGTHCAGIIAAKGNNGVGVCGVAWKAKLMGLRFLDDTGLGFEEDEIKGMDYAQKMGAKIISCSFGSSVPDTIGFEPEREAIEALGESGILVVVAAGNGVLNADKTAYIGINIDIKENGVYPASWNLPNMITVANNNLYDELSASSNYGVEKVHVAAPGYDIMSTSITSTGADNNYVLSSGTSMAAPHVSAAAGLIWSRHPEYTYTQVIDVIKNTGRVAPALDGKVSSGRVLDLYAALGGQPILTLKATATPSREYIEFSWTAISGKQYEIFRSTSETGEFKSISAGYTGWTYRDETAVPGVTYYYKVYATPNN